MLSAGPTVGCRRSLGFRRARVSVRRHGMYVPSDSFGGVSPERKASEALEKLFTFISAKIILAQLEGSGRGALAAYNQEQYTTLFSHLQDVPLGDPDQWLEQLMRKDKALALRVMEVRAAYSKEDFEWDQLQRLSVESIKRSNLQLMRKAATASLQATQLSSSQQLTAKQQQTAGEPTCSKSSTQDTPGSTASMQQQTAQPQQQQTLPAEASAMTAGDCSIEQTNSTNDTNASPPEDIGGEMLPPGQHVLGY
eukprot:GHUV01024579.1.p1 GENE.GHUV01024579.1~~GHUV01024579.1.p1  ORF type:complete len:252 (+),score=93.28 GHUV01024579.1:100-855(+)